VEEDLFEVTLPALRGARERLAGLEGLVASSYFGPRLHLFCQRGYYDACRLERAVRARGLQVDSVEAVAARLEDTFIRLVQKQAPPQ
jgi:hypothetical protein